MGCGASSDNKKKKEAEADAPVEKGTTSTMSLSWETLEKQDDVATKAALEFFASDETFKKLAE